MSDRGIDSSARRRRLAAMLLGGLLAMAAVAVALAATKGHEGKRVSAHPRLGARNPVSGVRLYVDPQSPAAVQVAQWHAAGNAADAATLQRIAGQPTAKWFGGEQDATAAAAALVGAASAAGAVAEIVLYNIPERDCHSYSSGGAAGGSAYIGWVKQIARGIGRHPAIVVLEPDAIDQAAEGCIPRAAAAERYRLLSLAVTALKSNPAARVYLDAGHSGWLSVRQMVGPLRRAGVERADGFALNVANFQTTRASVAYGRSISRRLGGRHFVVDTSRNGNGPVRAAPGIDRWCNPHGRALGHIPTTHTGDPLVDAFLWIKYPGKSDGACHPGDPPAGQWWPAYALELARATS
jgi:endoglucanase